MLVLSQEILVRIMLLKRFMLSWEILTRDYQDAQITIDLLFVTRRIVNQLIYCNIDEKIKNLFNYFSIRTMLNLWTQKKSRRRLRQNWKAINLEKFDNILRDLLFELILNNLIKRDDINKYTTKLLDALEKTIEDLIS